MSKAQPLANFDPVWLTDGSPSRMGVGSRYQMGVSFICPTHGPPCRLEFWFRDPCDGDPPAQGPRLWGRSGARLTQLTVYPLGPPAWRPIVVAGHWSGWVDAGHVYSGRRWNGDDTDEDTDPMVPVVKP